MVDLYPMRFINREFSVNELQVLVWIGVFLVIFFSLIPEDGLLMAAILTTISCVYYLLVIYGNISYLYPKYFETGKKVRYGIYAGIFVIVVDVARAYTLTSVYNHYTKDKPEVITWAMLLYYIIGGLLTFLLSFVFRIAIAYFTLKQQSEKILAQKGQAELSLLKAQVQPHFLFNTLNNIYYESYIEAPKTAKLIERLSDMMRYFLEESPKDLVPITTEVQFIENYIALEKIRIRHAIQLSFVKEYSDKTVLPPMLLMTFVENIFKHGIDKSSTGNKIVVSLKQQNSYLIFETANYLYISPGEKTSRGSGIINLRKRLEILYKRDFVLQTIREKDHFKALLKVPVYES